eukprot:293766_1
MAEEKKAENVEKDKIERRWLFRYFDINKLEKEMGNGFKKIVAANTVELVDDKQNIDQNNNSSNYEEIKVTNFQNPFPIKWLNGDAFIAIGYGHPKVWSLYIFDGRFVGVNGSGLYEAYKGYNKMSVKKMKKVGLYERNGGGGDTWWTARDCAEVIGFRPVISIKHHKFATDTCTMVLDEKKENAQITTPDFSRSFEIKWLNRFAFMVMGYGHPQIWSLFIWSGHGVGINGEDTEQTGLYERNGEGGDVWWKPVE